MIKRGKVRRHKINLLEIIYPTKCGICGKIAEKSICPKCKIKIEKLLVEKIDKISDKYFEKHFYLFKYEGIIRDKMLLFKFKDRPEFYKMFYEFIKNSKKLYEFLNKYDIIIPVPVHYYRKIKRGYNQSELIIKNIEQFSSIKLRTDILKRNKNLKPQSKLSKEARIRNIKNVYKIKNIQTIKDKKIIVFDDIYTTGSTVNECAKMLKQHGARKVDVFTFVRA